VDRILRRATPAALPVDEPIKFEPVINLRAAKALWAMMRPTLLARADEVIKKAPFAAVHPLASA
jgi:putative ABC transport system substrate-binding protein